MYCNNCGITNEEDAVFCKKCGAALMDEVLEEEQKEDKKDRNKKSTNKTKTKTKKGKNKKQKKNKTKNKKSKKYVDNSKEGMTIGQKLLMFILFILVLGLIGGLSYIGYKYYNQKDLVEVPNVVGLTYQQAESRLEESGLVAVKKIESTEELVQDNVVIDQNKETGKKVKKGSRVKVIVGEYETEVGEYVGIQIDTVKSKLESLGLKYQISEEISDKYSEGVVVYQSIKKGTKAKLNEVIKLVVSKAKEVKKETIDEEKVETETNDNSE